MFLLALLLVGLGAVVGDNPMTIQLIGTLRDFRMAGTPDGHPDFERYLCGLQRGLVQDTIGSDRKPTLRDARGCIDSAESFSQWFRTDSSVNVEIPYALTANWNPSTKSYEYTSHAFFPLDGQGFGNQGQGHNYAFTFELHTQFTYDPSQKFSFSGDDDVWVFINNQLVIDLGGVHTTQSASVSLNTLGLVAGNTYTLDFFFAERHTTDSNLVLSTSIVLDPCGSTDTDNDGVADNCDQCPEGPISATGDVPASAELGKPVTISATITGPAYSGPELLTTISFGDGTPSDTVTPTGLNTPASVTHTYAKAGTYTVTISIPSLAAGCTPSSNSYSISVVDPCGNNDNDGDGINDKCDPCPQGDLSIVFGKFQSPTKKVTGSFSLSGLLTDPYLPVTINYGDGTKETVNVSGGYNIAHEYPRSGNFKITVTGEGPEGCNNPTASIDIKVGDRAAPSCKSFSPSAAL